MKSDRLIKVAKRTVLVSFILGTLILMAYAWMRNDECLIIGGIFIVLTILINLIVLLLVLINSINNRQDRKRLLRAGLLMTVNIPILFLYIFFAEVIGQYMWITITNDSDYKLVDIYIQDCGSGYLQELEADASESIWVKVIHEGTISVRYSSEGKVFEKQIKGDGFGREELLVTIDNNGRITTGPSN